VTTNVTANKRSACGGCTCERQSCVRRAVVCGLALLLALCGSLAAAEDRLESTGHADAEAIIVEEAASTESESEARPEPEPRGAPVLDLTYAQERAMDSSPTLSIVEEQVAQARAKVLQARSAYYPQITSTYQYTRTEPSDFRTGQTREYLDIADDSLRNLDILLRDTALNVAPRTIRRLRREIREAEDVLTDFEDRFTEPFDRYQLTLTAGWLLFDGFGRKFTNAAARLGHLEARAGEREARRLLLNAVSDAYHGMLLARENIRIAEANEEFNQTLLDQAEARYDVGKGPYSDILNFKVAVRGARTARLRAEADFESAKIGLATLMGEPEALLPEAIEIPRLETETPDELAEFDEREAIRFALEHRPDITQSRYRVSRAEAQKRVSKAKYSPQIALFGTYGARQFNSTSIETDDFSATYGLTVSYDLFLGGRERAQVLEAKHAEREAEARLSEAELGAISEVRQAASALRIAQEQVVLQRLSTNDVEENRELVAKAYNAGKAPLALLNQAQRDLVQAQGQLALAVVSLRRAWESLHAATGHRLVEMEGFFDESEDRVIIRFRRASDRDDEEKK